MTRRPDWQLQLAAFAKSRASQPFAWGSNDCCMFAADAVLAMTDVDLAASLRGYDSALAATRILDARGGLQGVVSEVLGEPVSPRMAAVGDVVLLKNDGRDLLAICNGTNALAPGEIGMAVLDMSAARAAWKV